MVLKIFKIIKIQKVSFYIVLPKFSQKGKDLIFSMANLCQPFVSLHLSLDDFPFLKSTQFNLISKNCSGRKKQTRDDVAHVEK